MIQDDSNKLQNKLKNKKKDIIIADLTNNLEKTKPQETVKSIQIDNLISDTTKESNRNNDIEINSDNKTTSDSNCTNTLDGAGNINTKPKGTDGNEISKNSINKIILNLQFLLSLSSKVDNKLLNICSLYLSTEQFQSILEERDCRGVCGNMMCDRKLEEKKAREKKYIYQGNSKQFTKDNLSELFCDMNCFQKYKDVYAVAKKYDYFRLLHIDTIILFYILSNYYPDNLFLDEIKSSAEKILNSQKNKENLKEIIKKLKTKYDNYFYETNSNEEKGLDENEIGVSISGMFENTLNINK